MNWCARLLTLIGICNSDVIEYKDFKSEKSIINANTQSRWIANPPEPTTQNNDFFALLSLVVSCCPMLFDFFHANYHVIGHELVRTKEFMDNSWQFVFLFCCVSSVLPFFYLFFSASALFPPFSIFFLSEAVFYFLLYSETPQWDVSTSLQHIQTTKTTKDNIEQLLFCSIVPCCPLLFYVVLCCLTHYLR